MDCCRVNVHLGLHSDAEVRTWSRGDVHGVEVGDNLTIYCASDESAEKLAAAIREAQGNAPAAPQSEPAEEPQAA